MSEERINPISGKRQIKIEPDVLPAIWVDSEAGLCDRCKPYNECLNYNEISEFEWEGLNELLSSLNYEFINNKLNRSVEAYTDQLNYIDLEN